MKVKETKYKFYGFICPGCGRFHNLPTEINEYAKIKWEFNGDCDNPTFTPSILTKGYNDQEKVIDVCHCYVTNGRIEFLWDSTHFLAGQTIPLPEIDLDKYKVYFE